MNIRFGLSSFLLLPCTSWSPISIYRQSTVKNQLAKILQEIIPSENLYKKSFLQCLCTSHHPGPYLLGPSLHLSPYPHPALTSYPHFQPLISWLLVISGRVLLFPLSLHEGVLAGNEKYQTQSSIKSLKWETSFNRELVTTSTQ